MSRLISYVYKDQQALKSCIADSQVYLKTRKPNRCRDAGTCLGCSSEQRNCFNCLGRSGSLHETIVALCSPWGKQSGTP